MSEENRHPITKAVEKLVGGMCRYKSSLKITESMTSDGAITILIKPQPTDFRIVCGKDGRNIKALQLIVAKAGNTHGIRCRVELDDSFEGSADPIVKFKADPNFSVELFKRLLVTWCDMVFAKSPGYQFDSLLDGKLRVYLTTKSDELEAPMLIQALDSVFYPYGMANGRIVEIRKSK